MKILFVNITGSLGGAERLLLDLLASLARADPAPELHLVLAEDGPLAGLARCHGVAVTVLPLPRRLLELGDSALSRSGRWRQAVGLAPRALAGLWQAGGYARRLRKLIASLRPDVVHSNSLKFHLLGALAVPRGTPLVWHLHDFVGARVVMRRALGLLTRRVRGAVAVSHAVAADAGAALGGLPLVVVPNAVDAEHFSPGEGHGEWLDRLAGLPPAESGTVRVGLVATYARWKGHDVFLDAALRLCQREGHAPVRFYVVGGPIYQTRGSQWGREELEARAGGLVAAQKVGFVPFVGDTAPVYRGLDVVVHASTRPEPFGLTIVEGMACGRAVVVADAGGAAELFTHDHDAVGVRPGDADALAGILAELTADAPRRRRLGAAARETALTRFARGSLGPRMLAAYQELRATGRKDRAS